MNINCYADFVDSDAWDDAIEEIYKIYPEIAESIQKYGIGDSLGEGGYDFESGNLLVNLPEEIQQEISDNAEIYNLVSNLADEYYKFSIS
jgi:hypothetical protein